MKNADARSGRLTFSKTCAQCHKLFGEGNTIGPQVISRAIIGPSSTTSW